MQVNRTLTSLCLNSNELDAALIADALKVTGQAGRQAGWLAVWLAVWLACLCVV